MLIFDERPSYARLRRRTSHANSIAAATTAKAKAPLLASISGTEDDTVVVVVPPPPKKIRQLSHITTSYIAADYFYAKNG
jgi:hypothetical protein